MKRTTQIGGTSETTVYVCDAFGRLAAEYLSVAPAVGAGGTFYRTEDHLGSTRLVTKQDKSVVECRDFFPFGERIGSGLNGRSLTCYGGTGDALAQQFTGKERDKESSLDYFGARYYSARLGRFVSPDAPFADQFASAPQSWNLYGYVRNSPLVAIDPNGRETQICGLGTGEQTCEVVHENIADRVRDDKSFIVAGGDIYLRDEDGAQGQRIGSFEYLGPDGDLREEVRDMASAIVANTETPVNALTIGAMAIPALAAGAAEVPSAAAAMRPAMETVAVAGSAASQHISQSALRTGDYLFGRRRSVQSSRGLLNGRLPLIGDYFRLGYSWNEHKRHKVFRIVIGNQKLKIKGKLFHKHWDLWKH